MGFRVDAHHHVWRFTEQEYGWLDGDLRGLRRDFLPEELFVAMHSAAVGGAVAVQARQTQAETDWLLQLAVDTPHMLGVVGWLPIAHPGFGAMLERYADQPLLKGLRHVVQAEAEGFLEESRFNEGIDRLLTTGLVYDVLVYERQLEEVLRFVDRHPGETFVLDHLGKPRIAAGEVEPWASNIRELARRSNVTCKISGLVTEADPKNWTPADLKPYFDIALDAFTPERLMTGTDWPVLTAGCSYSRWWSTVSSWIAELTPGEQDDVLGDTAIRTYNLDVSGRD